MSREILSQLFRKLVISSSAPFCHLQGNTRYFDLYRMSSAQLSLTIQYRYSSAFNTYKTDTVSND